MHEVWTEDEIKDIPLQTAAKFLNSKPHGGNALYKSILANFLNNSNTASKVVDENGEPKVVYHGSDADFDVFDRSKGRSGMDVQGMFFSLWKDDAQGYGKKVSAFFLNIKNPANASQYYEAFAHYQGWRSSDFLSEPRRSRRGLGTGKRLMRHMRFAPSFRLKLC